MRSLTAHTLAGLVAAAILAAFLLAGCSTSTGPVDMPVPGVHYFARTSPDSVVANLRLAYENQHLTRYMECLAEDFTFYPSPQTVEEYEWIPESWGKIDEHRIHTNMFGGSGFARGIILDLLQQGEATPILGPTPGDTIGYEYTLGVDLRVDCQDSITYVATAPSLFLLRVDPDEVGGGGEPLWEILDWYDIDEDSSCVRPVLPTSWGELKAIFHDLDWD